MVELECRSENAEVRGRERGWLGDGGNPEIPWGRKAIWKVVGQSQNHMYPDLFLVR